MKKVIRDGLVAVLYSPNYTSGWYSEMARIPKYDINILLFHPVLVELVERGQQKYISKQLIAKILNTSVDAIPYIGGVTELRVDYIPEGSLSRIDNYDGHESVVVLDTENYVVA